MKVKTIANYKIEVSEKARESVPALAGKVQKEYDDYINKVMHTKENNTYLTEKQQEAINNGAPLEKYEKNIINKVNKSYCARPIKQINTVFAETRAAKRILITVDWIKKYDGNQAKATIKVLYDDYTEETYTSSRTNGGNYDKESTATQSALNQINAILKELFIMANKAIEAGKNYREFIGYGITYYNVVPFFDGGVGFNCHQHILEKLGFTFKHVSWTKKTDVYEFIR